MGDTFNTVSEEMDRGQTMRHSKSEKAELLLDCVEERFPGLRKVLKHIIRQRRYLTATMWEMMTAPCMVLLKITRTR